MHLSALEKRKYEKVWKIPSYRDHSPGDEMVKKFLEICQPKPNASVIDLGCGTGRASLKLQRAGLNVWGLDITGKALSRTARQKIPFIEAPLWSDWGEFGFRVDDCLLPPHWDFGFCCDVMEHIPIEYTMAVLQRMKANCRELFLHICLVPDSFGKMIGEPLHLTVMPFEWWLSHLQELGDVKDARDLVHNGLFHVG